MARRGRGARDVRVLDGGGLVATSFGRRNGEFVVLGVVTSEAQLTEVFTRVAKDTLQYDATLSDPATWTKPWTARIYFKRTDEPLLEYACHEGNVGLYGILSGARKLEAQQSSPR